MNIRDEYSVIIPTMWRSDKIFKMLPLYQSSGLVGEVIIIDNNPQNRPSFHYGKVKTFSKDKNIYVNPAWNWGLRLSSCAKWLIANDDIYIERFEDLISTVKPLMSEYDLIGLDWEGTRKEGTIEIRKISKFPKKSFGSFMFLNKYHFIPEDLKIFYGDEFLFAKSDRTGIFSGIKAETNVSETLKSENFKSITKIDKYHYINKYRKGLNWIK